MTLQLLETSNAIRKALGKAYDVIQCFDALPRERAKSSSRRQLINRHGPLCATCGQQSRVYGAHILALEEGGLTTRENLILLCYDCHGLYDQGYASRKEMEEVAKSWRNGTISPLKDVMLVRKEQGRDEDAFLRPRIDPEGVLEGAAVYDKLHQRHWDKALRALKEVQTRSTSQEDRQLLTIVEAQIQRRRAARGVLDKARRLLETVDADRLPVERRPFYFYELGYIKRLLGLTSEASDCFLKSWQCASDLRDEYAPLEALIAEVSQITTEVIAAPTIPAMSQYSIASYINRLDAAAQRAGHLGEQLGGPFGSRWALNCRAWKVNLLLKCGDHEMARQAFIDAREIRDRQDVTTGWTVDARPTITALEGLLLVLHPQATEEQIKEGLRLLARALVPLLTARQQPEGIRDKLLGFENGLHLLRQRGERTPQRVVENMSRVREKIMDGSSFLDPYRLAG